MWRSPIEMSSPIVCNHHPFILPIIAEIDLLTPRIWLDDSLDVPIDFRHSKDEYTTYLDVSGCHCMSVQLVV
jgi:hypothetical protein